MNTTEDYRYACEALAVAVAARVPVVLWGPPGQGKTSAVRAVAEHSQRHLEVLLASIREPQDFAGLPSIADGRAVLAAPDWAVRLAQAGDGVLFADEVNTAPPSVQAALLRVCLDRVVGDLPLGERTSVIAAANPPELAADGWDLAPPLANRFCHLDWELPMPVVREGFAGSWPTVELPAVDETKLGELVAQELVAVGGFLTARPDLTTALPRSVAEQGRAFPTPRSWEMAAVVSAYAQAAGVSPMTRRLLVQGCVGIGAASEYLSYLDNLDLPDPNRVLDDPSGTELPTRADRLYVIAAGVLTVLRGQTATRRGAKRWASAGTLLARIAEAGHPDIAVGLARDWLALKPTTAAPDPDTVGALLPLLREAGLL